MTRRTFFAACAGLAVLPPAKLAGSAMITEKTFTMLTVGPAGWTKPNDRLRYYLVKDGIWREIK